MHIELLWHKRITKFWCQGSTLLALFLLVTIIALLSLNLRKQVYKPQLTTEASSANPFETYDVNVDFRGQPRKVSSKKGVVAADHSRCSEEGTKILKVCFVLFSSCFLPSVGNISISRNHLKEHPVTCFLSMSCGTCSYVAADFPLIGNKTMFCLG